MRIATLSLTILCLALSAPAFASPGVFYSDGPTNGTVNAFFIDGPGTGPFSQTISDGFFPIMGGTPTSLTFGEWVPSGTTPTSVTWWLGLSVFATTYTGTTLQVSYVPVLLNNGFGFDVYDVTVPLSGNVTFGVENWLTLGGANDSGLTQFDAWDVNGGPASCDFAVGGAPQGDCGFGLGVEGEAFTITGGSTVPEPGSIMLFGSGILGLAGVLRRKINL